MSSYLLFYYMTIPIINWIYCWWIFRFLLLQIMLQCTFLHMSSHAHMRKFSQGYYLEVELQSIRIYGFDSNVSDNSICISTVESSYSFAFLPKSGIIRLSNFCQSSEYEVKFNEFCISLITKAGEYLLYMHTFCLFF